MEASVTTPVGGTVKRVVVQGPAQVAGGDLVVEIETA